MKGWGVWGGAVLLPQEGQQPPGTAGRPKPDPMLGLQRVALENQGTGLGEGGHHILSLYLQRSKVELTGRVLIKTASCGPHSSSLPSSWEKTLVTRVWQGVSDFVNWAS